MTIQQWLTQQIQHFTSDIPQLEAELLLCHRLNKSRAYLFTYPDEQLSETLLTQLSTDIRQLASGYPLAYLLGKKAFWDMELSVTPDTLIPRADTELLIELMLERFAPDCQSHFIDLGTGSGAIAIALSREFPSAQITATDFSHKALTVAKANAKVWQKSPIEFIQTSWLSGFDTQDTFDVIISNPPYIKENDKHLADLSHEPITALTATNNGLADIQTIITQSADCLKSKGWLLLEHGYQQGEAVRTCFAQPLLWTNINTLKDLSGNDRVTLAQRV